MVSELCWDPKYCWQNHWFEKSVGRLLDTCISMKGSKFCKSRRGRGIDQTSLLLSSLFSLSRIHSWVSWVGKHDIQVYKFSNFSVYFTDIYRCTQCDVCFAYVDFLIKHAKHNHKTVMTAADLPNKTLHYSSQYLASQGLLNSDDNVTDKENLCISSSQCGQGDKPKQKTSSKTSEMSISSECNARKNSTVNADECSEDQMTERKNPLDMLHINSIPPKVNTNVNGGNKMSQKHKGDKRYKCGMCWYSTDDIRNIKRHQMLHTGDKPYKCDVCGFCTAHMGDLKRHQRKHTGDKPYKCDQCAYSANQKVHLTRHQLVHTDDRPYKCNECGYSAKRRDDLKIHQRTHTEDKPYRCDECGYSATVLSSVKEHKRIHTGEKPFRCDVCGYSTTHMSHLKAHQMIHTDDKPYKCDICGYSTRWMHVLRRHRKKHAQDWRMNWQLSLIDVAPL